MRPVIRSGARISPCLRYRYNLYREWDTSKLNQIWIMLNPSTANSNLDDPTIRRCMGFARREGFGGIEVINLFAARSSSPSFLHSIDDPIGPENDIVLEETTAFNKSVVAAWGVHGSFKHRDQYVVDKLAELRVSVVCLGKTKQGAPRHPLYVKGDQPFEGFMI